MESTSSTLPESVVNAPYPTASGRVPLSSRAALFAIAVAVVVPVLFVLTLVVLLMATNYNLLDWME